MYHIAVRVVFDRSTPVLHSSCCPHRPRWLLKGRTPLLGTFSGILWYEPCLSIPPATLPSPVAMQKFLVNRDGEAVARYDMAFDAPQLEADIEAQLAQQAVM